MKISIISASHRMNSQSKKISGLIKINLHKIDYQLDTYILDLADVGFSSPGASENQKVVSWDNSAGEFVLSSVSGLSGSGETNTASNQGTAGVGVFYQKSGEDLQFKNINAGSAKITVTDDTSNNEIDIDFGTVSIDDLSDVDITTSAPSDGQALVWNNSNSEFEPGDLTSTFSALTDTSFSSLSNNDIAKYNGSNWENVSLITDNVSEGTNLYYTEQRVRDYLQGTHNADIFPDTAGSRSLGSASRDYAGVYADNVYADALTTVAGTGTITVKNSLIPETDNTIDLGSTTNKWRSLFLSWTK